MSDFIAGNLILEITDPELPAPDFTWVTRWGEQQPRPSIPISIGGPSHLRNNYTASARDRPYEWWRMTEYNGNLLEKLQRMKEAPSRKPTTRFMLDSRWEANKYNNCSTNSIMLGEIFRDVGEAFGDELMVVICCQGVDIQKDFRAHVPRNIKQLERLSLNLRSPATTQASMSPKGKATSADTLLNTSSRTRSINLRNGRNQKPPSPRYAKPSTNEELSASAPISLHLYFGYEQRYADFTMGDIIKAFANKDLETIYFCSDPNNFNLVGAACRGKNSAPVHNSSRIYESLAISVASSLICLRNTKKHNPRLLTVLV